MTYHNAIKYIKSAPVAIAEDTPFERIRLLLGELCEPQRRIRHLRLAGSNGKSLCGEMLTSVLRHTNVRTGLLSMPVREDVRSSIRIDGDALSMDELVLYTEQVAKAVLQIRAHQSAEADSAESVPSPAPFTPTGSEILLAVALLAFEKKSCDLVIIESDHETSDPSRFLPSPIAAVVCGTIPHGDRAQIARIRSYITRGVQEIVSAPQNPEAHRYLSDTCASVNCRLTLPKAHALRIDRLTLRKTEFSYQDVSYTLNLCGRFQVINAVVVLESVAMLTRRGYEIPQEAVQKGFSSLHIPAKFELVSSMPYIIVDSTHTPEAIEAVSDAMAEFRPVTGNRIRICLPSGDLPEQYLRALEDRGYTVEKIVILGQEDETLPSLPCPCVYAKTAKSASRLCLAELGSDGFLLISGTHGFAEQIRYELLQSLGFS
ncbi:MAG: hypothetical protein J6R04_04440 [Clostridia bacterium]|nr:hypothetical protein [Clostridia bacterium]